MLHEVFLCYVARLHLEHLRWWGDRGAVWFGFEHKSHLNREIKMHAVRFGSVDFKRSFKPNRTKPMRLGSVRLLRFIA
jgi:hypothetical protein